MAVLPPESWYEMDPDFRWRASSGYEAVGPPSPDSFLQRRAAGDADRAIREVLLACNRFPPGYEAGRGWKAEAPETPETTGPVERYRGLIVIHWSGKTDRLAVVMNTMIWITTALLLVITFFIGYSVGAGQHPTEPTPVIKELPGG